jgi:hypothetical protein
MGWYVTCAICGTEGKYGLNCDCYQKETQRNLDRLKGCVIEESFVIIDWAMFLLQKLRPPSGEVFYLRICIADMGGEGTCFRRVVEISAEEFVEYQGHSERRNSEDVVEAYDADDEYNSKNTTADVSENEAVLV